MQVAPRPKGRSRISVGNIIVPPTASFSGCNDGHGVSPYQLIVRSLAPPLKFHV